MRLTPGRAAECLDDILHEFRTVAFEPLPFLCAADAFVGNRLTAEAILADPGLDICQTSAGGQADKQKAALVHELDAVCFGCCPEIHRFFDCPVYIPPEFGDVGIGIPPCIYQRFQLLFWNAHLQSAHRFESAHGAAVAQRQFSDLAFLTEVTVDAMLLHGYAKHL